MSGIETEFRNLIKKLGEEKRLADKRAKQTAATTNKARAYLNVDQENIPNTTWTLVDLDTENFDPGGNFDIVNHRFVAPVAGFYLIIGKVTWVAASIVADKTYYTGIFVNGTLKAAGPSQSSWVNVVDSCVSTIEYIGAGQNIELYCYHNAGVDTPDVDGGTTWQTYLAIHLLSL